MQRKFCSCVTSIGYQLLPFSLDSLFIYIYYIYMKMWIQQLKPSFEFNYKVFYESGMIHVVNYQNLSSSESVNELLRIIFCNTAAQLFRIPGNNEVHIGI